MTLRRQKAVYMDDYDTVPNPPRMNAPLSQSRRVRSAVDIAALFMYGKPTSDKEDREILLNLFKQNKQQSVDATMVTPIHGEQKQ